MWAELAEDHGIGSNYSYVDSLFEWPVLRLHFERSFPANIFHCLFCHFIPMEQVLRAIPRPFVVRKRHNRRPVSSVAVVDKFRFSLRAGRATFLLTLILFSTSTSSHRLPHRHLILPNHHQPRLFAPYSRGLGKLRRLWFIFLPTPLHLCPTASLLLP